MSSWKTRLVELSTCSICLDSLNDPKMLPCQHTYCLVCLQKMMGELTTVLRCPQCRTEFVVPSGGVRNFPSNSLIMQSLQDIISTVDKVAAACDTCKETRDVRPCRRCWRCFCAICEQKHLFDFPQQLREMTRQLIQEQEKATKKIESFVKQCNQLKEEIKAAIERKLSNMIREVDEICEEGTVVGAKVVSTLEGQTKKLVHVVNDDMCRSSSMTDTEKAALFFRVNNETLSMLRLADSMLVDAPKFSAASLTVTKPVLAGTDSKQLLDAFHVNHSTSEASSSQPSLLPFNFGDVSSEERAISMLYSLRKYVLKAVLRPCDDSVPTTVAACPWSNEIYVTRLNGGLVMVYDLQQKTFKRSFKYGFSRGKHASFVAVSKAFQEIYVTDTSQKCIHVFSKDEWYISQIGGHNKDEVEFQNPGALCVDNSGYIFICDGSVIKVVKRDGTFVRLIQLQLLPARESGARTRVTSLSGIAVAANGQRLIVCVDNKVHVFKGDGSYLMTLRDSEQSTLDNPTCVCTDSDGFVVVGGSSDDRIQIFCPDGVRVSSLGKSTIGNFGVPSGIAVTENREIIVCDPDEQCIRVF